MKKSVCDANAAPSLLVPLLSGGVAHDLSSEALARVEEVEALLVGGHDVVVSLSVSASEVSRARDLVAVVDEGALVVGVRTMASLAVNYLSAAPK